MDRKEDFANKHVPQQEIGEQMDAIEKRTFENEAAAIDFFMLAKHRLLNVNEWSLLAGNGLSEFQLTNAFGNPIEGLAKEGDYLKIDIPGPGSSTGEGYDWVYIEAVIEEREVGMEAVTLRARPASNPLSNNGDTAHFLTEQATSTFQVKRIGEFVYAEEHGRNELANAYTTSTVDNIRNTLVGWAAMLGFSYPQWKSLVKGILAD